MDKIARISALIFSLSVFFSIAGHSKSATDSTIQTTKDSLLSSYIIKNKHHINNGNWLCFHTAIVLDMNKPKKKVVAKKVVVNHRFLERDPAIVAYYQEGYNSEAPKNLDSLLDNWYTKLSMKQARVMAFNEIPDSLYKLPDSVYIARLQSIQSGIDLPFGERARKYIVQYTNPRAKRYIESLIGRAEYYFPMFEEVLDLYGVPLELKYLPIIESALNPKAVSFAGATGIWQFMKGTGTMYDLKGSS